MAHFFLHLPGDLPVAEVSFHAGPEAADVLSFGEVHAKKEPRAGPEWEEILRARLRQSIRGFEYRIEHVLIFRRKTGIDKSGGRVVSERGAIPLPQLLTAPVAMQVAIGSNVHDDVVDIWPSAKRPKQLVARCS